MTKTGGSKHQKRIAAPRIWKINRKGNKFTVRTDPGPHKKDESIPLLIVLRDIFQLAETARETRFILNKKLVKIDGKVVTNPKHPVGLMDYIQLEKINKTYQLLPAKKHNLKFVELKDKPDKLVKLCQIKGKTTCKGGQCQLNLHDGRNILLPKEDKREQQLKTRDTILITVPSQEIEEHLPFKEGMYAVITDGQNVGKHGKIKQLDWRYGPRASTVTLTDPNGLEVRTTPEYTFVIGEKSPMIPVPES